MRRARLAEPCFEHADDGRRSPSANRRGNDNECRQHDNQINDLNHARHNIVLADRYHDAIACKSSWSAVMSKPSSDLPSTKSSSEIIATTSCKFCPSQDISTSWLPPHV